MSDACQPILRYGGSTWRPGVRAGTMIALTSVGPPFWPPVRAVMVMMEVIGVPELVMNAF